MLNKIRGLIEEKGLLEKKDKVVAGVSGGADSVCLFFVLLSLREEYALSLAVVHVNHGIRGEQADGDEAFVEELCAKHGVRFRSVREDVEGLSRREGLSVEEAGRLIRYRSFEQVRRELGYNKIAVAHNEEDQSESILLNLFRGSGLKGLSGMAPCSGRLIRPLLTTSRAEIEAYLSERGIAYRTDQSNFSDTYTRNRIRLRLLPYITREINAGAVKHIVKAAGMVREAEEYIEKNTNFSFGRMVRVKNGKYFIDAQEFRREEAVIQKKVLLRIVGELAGHLKDIGSIHVDMLLALVDKPAGKRSALPYGITAVREYADLCLYRGTQRGEPDGYRPIPIGAEGRYVLKGYGSAAVVSFPEGGFGQIADIIKNDYTKWFDYDKIRNTVFFRYWKEGDFLVIDREGHRKKLKDYFADCKIPHGEREKIPLLADGSHVMWVVGGRISEAYKVDNNTVHMMKVRIDKEEENGR